MDPEKEELINRYKTEHRRLVDREREYALSFSSIILQI